ncbi:MAG: S1 RNA-binding domain-containing protein [Ruminococcaceae bacterium]|nr:S1 RNA-binding domain-containing protein [Oscillospiraceae bacterium]
MELAVGNIVTGKVTTITKFGAFVSLESGKSGLVHISEVASAFVNDVHDFLTEGQEVQVKILSIAPDGKINLSVKQAQPQPPRPSRPVRSGSAPQGAPVRSRPAQAQAQVQPQAQPAAAPAEPSFEDKLKQFMTLSDSKQSELNRYIAGKRGGRRRK